MFINGKAKFAPISAKLLIDSPLSGDGHPYKNVKPKDDPEEKESFLVGANITV